MIEAYVISHITDYGSENYKSTIIAVAPSIESAKKFVESVFVAKRKKAVESQWLGSSAETIAIYMPNFVKDQTFDKYVSLNTQEAVLIEEFDMIN